MNHQPDLSIVVCTHNRAEMLRNALSSLARQRLPEGITAEILVVDNASNDATPQVVKDVARESPVAVRYALESQRGVVHARNRGVAEAGGEWIAFFDDDQLAEPDWIAELVDAARRKQVRCVGGSVVLKLPDGCDRRLAPFCRVLLGETVGRNSPRAYDRRFTPGTGNLLVHRSLFDEVGLFDPAFHQRGEDTDLFLRMLHAGVRGWFNPRAKVHHVTPPERMTDEYLLRLSRLMAQGMAADERRAHGPWKYPFLWLARLGQAVGVILPCRILAFLFRNHEAASGARCRWAVASRSLRDGLRLMFRRKGGALNPALSSASSQPDASAVSNRDMCLNRNPL
jgi:glycosyltransferase involved in cell wall biosynthesis